MQVGVAVNILSPQSATRSEADLDVMIAQRVSEATIGFDPGEIARLKVLAESVEQSSASPNHWP